MYAVCCMLSDAEVQSTTLCGPTTQTRAWAQRLAYAILYESICMHTDMSSTAFSAKQGVADAASASCGTAPSGSCHAILARACSDPGHASGHSQAKHSYISRMLHPICSTIVLKMLIADHECRLPWLLRKMKHSHQAMILMTRRQRRRVQ